MSRSIERIGVLTAGGDCPGLNAVIRAVTKTAIYRYGIHVLGIEDGFQGLAENRMGTLSSLQVSGVLARGGTILGSNNRFDPARVHTGTGASGAPIFEDHTERCIAHIERRGLDALIVIGGDGTMSIAAPLAARGVNCIGVPKTIDNDLVGTDITFGFLTATDTATEALDRLHSTAESHHRVIVCEVMGRNAGWIALHSGVASGSDVILIPEIPFDLDAIAAFVQGRRSRQRGFSIVVCAEGAAPREGQKVVAFEDPTSPDPVRLGGIGERVAEAIRERTGIDTRTTVLGHIQRGGAPIPADRVLATQFGHHALELLLDGARNRMVVMQGRELGDVDLEHAANRQRLVPLDHPLLDAARGVKTSFGE